MTGFHKVSLGVLGALAAVLVTAAVVHPPAGGASAPKPAPRLDVDVAALDLAAGPRLVSAQVERLDVDAVARKFAQLKYDLPSVGAGYAEVPRVFLASLPSDMAAIREAEDRKQVFFKSILPLVLQVNEEILTDRKRLWDIRYRLRSGQRLGPVDRLWLIVKAERYRVERDDLEALAGRMDVVPPSLALAQAAEESGWGTSRFAREGNAIFGEWTFGSKDGMIPAERAAGKTHKVRVFDSLLDSVRAYARNLNTHRAYAELRTARAEMRQRGAPIDGHKLTAHLIRYSERGQAYVDTIRTIMRVNDLSRLDDARLERTYRVAADEPAI